MTTMKQTKYRQKKKKNFIPVIIIAVILLLAGLAVMIYKIQQDKILRTIYPIQYEEYVEKYARENGLNKFLVYAVIKTESDFRSDAVSDVGARGLMQIMEDTFDWIKYKTDDEETYYYDMYNAEINIRYGCWLLGYLDEEFGNVEAVAAAYHAGRGNVNDWLEDKRYSKDGVHLDNIPIGDTEHYVHKITKAMNNYVKLYGEEE